VNRRQTSTRLIKKINLSHSTTGLISLRKQQFATFIANTRTTRLVPASGEKWGAEAIFDYANELRFFVIMK
jgi:hypothetical protein